MLLLVVTSLEQLSDAWGWQVFLQFCSISDYAIDSFEGGSAVDIPDAPTPSRTSQAPRGEKRDMVSRWGFALSARPPGSAYPRCGARLGCIDRGHHGFGRARFAAAFHRLRRHESAFQGGKRPASCVSRSSAVSSMPAPVPGKNWYCAAWSWDFPSPNRFYVSAGFHLPWLWH
jgi:hypothetical protein